MEDNTKNNNNATCDKGWHDGSCCCNCAHQRKLMCHPWNGNNKSFGFLPDKIKFGQGPINKQCGWVCVGPFEDSNNAIYFDFEHGMCEEYERRKSNK